MKRPAGIPMTAYAPKIENCTRPDSALEICNTFWKWRFNTSPIVIAMPHNIKRDVTKIKTTRYSFLVKAGFAEVVPALSGRWDATSTVSMLMFRFGKRPLFRSNGRAGNRLKRLNYCLYRFQPHFLPK